MLVGATGSGKTSLANVLNRYGEGVAGTHFADCLADYKGQDVRYGRHTIDVPGGYFENPWMYNHLIALAQNHASHVLFLMGQSRRSVVGAPGLTTAFNCPVTGVVTQSDVHPENTDFCLKQLRHFGVSEPFFSVSVADGTGIPELIKHLF